MQETDTIFRNARNNKLELSDKNFTSLFRLTKVKPVDDYGNTLLHITTEHANEKFVGELLDADYDPLQTNKFGKSSWDIAVASQNKPLIEKFVSRRITRSMQVVENRNALLTTENTNLSKKRKELESSISDLESQNKKLSLVVTKYETQESDKSREITLLTRSKTTLLNENNALKRSIADIQSDNVVLKNTNKRLREDNEELKDANKKLKSSVDALITASMK